MVDVATLGFQVDSRQVRTASGDLDRFGRSAVGAERSTSRMSQGFSGFARGAAVAAGALAGAAAAVATLGAAMRTADRYASLNNGLMGIGHTAAEASGALERLTDIAISTRSPLEATTQLYQRLSIAGRDLGASQEQVFQFTENVGLALAASGTSASEASGALLQLSQAMAGGVVRAEEFNSILDGAFPIAQAAANAIDGAAGSVGRLRQMVVDGEISSREFFDAVLSQSEALEEAFANTNITISQAMTNLQTSLMVAIGGMDQALGISTSLAEALNGVAIVIRELTGWFTSSGDAASSASVSFGKLLGPISGIAGAITGSIAQFARLISITGSTASAFSLLGDVAREAWDRIRLGTAALSMTVQGHWMSIKASVIGTIADILNQTTGFTNDIIGAFVGAYEGVVAAWALLPSALGGIAANAVNALVGTMEAGINRVITGLNRIPGIDIGGVELGRVDGGGVSPGDVFAAASGAAAAAFERDYVTPVSNGLRQIADDTSEAADIFSAMGSAAREAATAPLESMTLLNEVLATSEETAGAAADATNTLTNELNGGGGGSGGGGGVAEAMEEATTFAGGLAEAFEEARMSAADMGREFGNNVIGAIDGVASAFGDFVSRGFRDFQDFAQSILQTFQRLLSQMIAMAVRNRIMIGLGISGGGAGAAVAGGNGGLLGNLLGGGGSGGGMLGGLLGSFGQGGSILGMGGLAGGTGLLGGLGNAVSGGLGGIFNIGANAAAAGGGLLATLGAAVPIIGGIALAFSFFKTKTKELDSGIQANISGMDVMVRNFRKVEKSRFFGLSKKVSTSLSAADDATTDYVTEMVHNLQDGVYSAADALNIAADTFAGFTHVMRVSTKGLSEEAAQEAIEEGLRGVADAMAEMVPGIGAFMQAGEGASDTLDRLASRLTNVNLWMGNLMLNVYEVGLAGAGAASSFVDLFGSLEDFTSASSAYYQAFYSDAERTARATELLSMELAALGIDTLPASRAAFRALVDEADALGNSDLVASLIQLAPAFAEIKDEANALNNALSNNGLYRTLADAVYANTAGGYQKPIEDVLARGGSETNELLREVLQAIRDGDVNNARINSKILAIQERADLEPPT